jgi:hypothetical protein
MGLGIRRICKRSILGMLYSGEVGLHSAKLYNVLFKIYRREELFSLNSRRKRRYLFTLLIPISTI